MASLKRKFWIGDYLVKSKCTSVFNNQYFIIFCFLALCQGYVIVKTFMILDLIVITLVKLPIRQVNFVWLLCTVVLLGMLVPPHF